MLYDDDPHRRPHWPIWSDDRTAQPDDPNLPGDDEQPDPADDDSVGEA
jgi:hypothetical protein